jgi:hypothetical protein
LLKLLLLIESNTLMWISLGVSNILSEIVLLLLGESQVNSVISGSKGVQIIVNLVKNSHPIHPEAHNE